MIYAWNIIEQIFNISIHFGFWSFESDIMSKKMNKLSSFCKECCLWSDGVVVITSALHADGREFDPRSDLSVFC